MIFCRVECERLCLTCCAHQDVTSQEAYYFAHEVPEAPVAAARQRKTASVARRKRGRPRKAELIDESPSSVSSIDSVSKNSRKRKAEFEDSESKSSGKLLSSGADSYVVVASGSGKQIVDTRQVQAAIINSNKNSSAHAQSSSTSGRLKSGTHNGNPLEGRIYSATRKVGSRCYVKHPNGQWYWGVITKLKGRGRPGRKTKFNVSLLCCKPNVDIESSRSYIFIVQV